MALKGPSQEGKRTWVPEAIRPDMTREHGIIATSNDIAE